MTLSWNIVAKHIHPHEQLQTKLREKVAKLEKYLQTFPPDAVHLQVSLDRHVKNGRFTVALTLRLPSNILHSKKSASDPIPALDQAIKALLRELASLKSDLRREPQRSQHQRRRERQETTPARFADLPLPAGQGPQTLAETVRDFMARHYGQLLYHVRRQLWRAETQAAIPPHAIDAEAVADEVARQVFLRAETKPQELSYRLWLYSLAREELGKRFHELKERAATSVPLDQIEPPLRRQQVGADGAGKPLSAFEESFEDEEVWPQDITPDAHAVPPDAAAAEHDLIDYFHRVAQGWPASERNVFELHFLEGFELDEVAMLEKMRVPQVRTLVELVQERLRRTLAEAVQIRASHFRKGPDGRSALARGQRLVRANRPRKA